MGVAIKDEIWMTLIEELARGESFKIKELDDIPESQRKTARRTLRVMEENGWVERDPPRSSIWQPGPLSRVYFTGTGSPDVFGYPHDDDPESVGGEEPRQ